MKEENSLLLKQSITNYILQKKKQTLKINLDSKNRLKITLMKKKTGRRC